MIRDLFETPKSVTSLRAYWKMPGLPDPAEMAQELLGESDRAAIILAGSLLDDALKYRISQSLAIEATEKQITSIFDYPGPLGTFSDRTSLAYIFGFIDKTTTKQLNDIRELRNGCAHSTKPMSFSVPQVANVVKRLLHPTGTAQLKESSPAGMKGAFVFEFLYIHNTLIHGSREAGVQSINEAWAEAQSEPSP